MRKFIRSLFSGFILLLSWAPLSSTVPIILPQLQQEPQHSAASKRIADCFVRSHYVQFKFDKKFSAKIFDRYLRLLDPQHNLLLAADVERLSSNKNNLVEEITRGDLDNAYSIYNFVQALRLKRYLYAITLLDKEFHFDKHGYYEYDRSKASWPNDKSEQDLLWYNRVKFDALNLVLAGKPWPEIRKILTKRYQSIIGQLKLAKSEDVFFLLMNALAREIDPHTSYLSPHIAEQFKSDISLTLEGIGAVLRSEDDYVVVHALIPGGPAAKSNAIEIQDRIIGVANPGQKMVDVVGLRLDDVVSILKGPKGSKVHLEILSAKKKGSTRKLTLIRDRIRLEDRAIKASTRVEGRKKLGILEIPSFYIGLTGEVKKKLEWFEKEGIVGLIIDLRGNGGGALDEAVNLSSLFIPRGPVVQVRNRNGGVAISGNFSNSQRYEGEIVLLVDRFSASASEIFAAAMQDYGRALVAGEQTFGKGTVQQHQSIGNFCEANTSKFGYLQFTIQKFYRVSGGSTQLKGVIPDITILPEIYSLDIGERFQENPLPWDNITATTYKKITTLAPYLKRLRESHIARNVVNEEFFFLKQLWSLYNSTQDKKGSISLNIAQRKLEKQKEEEILQARDAKREEIHGKKQSTEAPNGESKPDPFLDETVAITLDWLELRGEQNCKTLDRAG